eukprot:jgi/Chrzof1/5453/Cz16g03190.t1
MILASIMSACAFSSRAPAQAEQCQLQLSPSGLQYCDIQEGQGPEPIKGSFIKAHYTAKLASNGVVFDSSYAKKQPLIFKVGEREVIAGWDEGILGDGQGVPPMREGGKRLLVLPPGPLQRQGTKSLVWMVGMLDALEDSGELSPTGSPTSSLIFEVELVPKRKR